MPKALAFFPWVSTEEIITIDGIRLIPYVRGTLPENLPNATLKDIDGVLSAYHSDKDTVISKATLIEVDQWQLGLDAENYIQNLLRTKELIAFSALSHRRLFRNRLSYTNYDSYYMVVQKYDSDSPNTFAFPTRHRHGVAWSLWSSDCFAFTRPNHVDNDHHIAFDRPLMEALLKLDSSHERLFEALIEFNSANSDSFTIPEHVELVMMKSAFEGLLDVNQRADEFARALLDLLRDILPPYEDKSNKSVWMRSPAAERPIGAWAREFSAIRGSAAHGKQRRRIDSVWQAHSHLAFASLLFPLLVKKKLTDMQLMELDPHDQDKLIRIEQYIASDPFNHNRTKTHPWVEIDAAASFSSIRRTIVQAIISSDND